jgi:hypothetical protein
VFFRHERVMRDLTWKTRRVRRATVGSHTLFTVLALVLANQATITDTDTALLWARLTIGFVIGSVVVEAALLLYWATLVRLAEQQRVVADAPVSPPPDAAAIGWRPGRPAPVRRAARTTFRVVFVLASCLAEVASALTAADVLANGGWWQGPAPVVALFAICVFVMAVILFGWTIWWLFVWLPEWLKARAKERLRRPARPFDPRDK